MPQNEAGFWVPPPNVPPSEVHSRHSSKYKYQDPIPPITTLTPCQIMERLYAGRRNAIDWTDPRILSRQLAVFRDHPDNVAAPLGSPGLVGKWPHPHGLHAVPVPVCDSSSKPVPMQAVVPFRNRDKSGCSTGISLGDIYAQNSSPLEGADDFVLTEQWGTQAVLNFVIAWPGYPPEHSSIRASESNGAPLSRFRLGQLITKAYARFFTKVESEWLLPSEVGFFNIALHQGQNARSDSLGVQITQLRLVDLCSTLEGYWVANIEIV